jgi:hypothetical protein
MSRSSELGCGQRATAISSARLRTTIGIEYSGDLHDYHTMTASFHKPSLRHPDWQDIPIPGAPRQGKGRHAVQQTG